MSKFLRIAFATGLMALTSGAAMAQTGSASAAYRNQQQINQDYSYREYGLGDVCKDRPFAPGCDKRGFW